MDKHLSEKALKILKNKDTIVLNNPKSLKNKIFKKERKVSVVIAAYNAASYIQNCIDSVLNQTLHFELIELIVIDDHSNDDTANIILNYAKMHSNITVVLLKENTGTAAMPRNIGIELTTTEKIIFLDSDDWLAENALSTLVSTMDETEDDFVVGKTVKVEDKGESILAEFVSYKVRKHVSPFDIPYLFYHMGPQSKLMRTSILKENNIRFPEMKFGEDKYFLFNVLSKCSKVTTIKDPICYLNRLSTNNSSLTKTTEVLDKRAADMMILKYILDKQVPLEQEKVFMKRLVEYDLVKTCDSFVFVKSKEKLKFIEIIREALYRLKGRSYDIIEMFDTPLYKVAARLIESKRDQDFIELFQWYKLEKNKHIIIQNGIAYYKVTPFSDDDPFKLIPIDLFVRSKDSYVEDNHYVQTFEIYGECITKVEYVLIRDRHQLANEIEIPLKINGNVGEFRVNYNELNRLDNSLFSVFVRYDGFRLANIRRMLENQVTYDNRNFVFYTTKVGNVGLSLKEKE
ncbi:glycosyltransferase family 2 protein [Bacillus sp. V3B]|uniref:glycosyltransferase family 2 protein n=1 Tax=Bacillus sp. V3B TaxID=2804915 RepID=UPI0021097B30|nr:glycosyltransferase family 2 protein [Bacillus sp. V3B]MCQ6276852.1 glycosyltransferase family 2 protein [Bacillus sp. V3B]